MSRIRCGHHAIRAGLVLALLALGFTIRGDISCQPTRAGEPGRPLGPALINPGSEAEAQQSDEPENQLEQELDQQRTAQSDQQPEQQTRPQPSPSAGSSDEPSPPEPSRPDKPAAADDSPPAEGPPPAEGSLPAEGNPEEQLPWPGERLAPGMVKLLQQEMLSGLEKRGIVGQFQLFRRYAGSRLDATARPHTGSELTGNCRLRWYDHLMRNPLDAPAEAEQFTRHLHRALLAPEGGLGRLGAVISDKLDLGPREAAPLRQADSPQAALDLVQQALTDARQAHARLLAPLKPSEVGELSRGLYPVLTAQATIGHTLGNRPAARRLCDIMEKLDRRALFDAMDALAPLADPAVLDQLAALEEAEPLAPGDQPASTASLPGVTGTVLRRIDTPAGSLLIGGRGPNRYELDKLAGLAALIDLGGDDVYLEGSVAPARPVLLLIDLEGNDNYQASQPGVQGSAILGISMLVDRSGNDIYRARDVAQGSALGGLGILVDHQGDDTYVGLRRVQGQAFGGLGLLIDRAGNDRYRGALWTQGFGGPLGFGLLDDLDGRDHYYTGGYYPDSYPETPGYEGWGQGVGAGPRQVANGGIGVILDGGGDDIYEFDYLAHGGGYWCGLGFARDFGGNDQRLGATRTAYNGAARTQQRFQRFANGYACHYAAGFLFDDAGDDVYDGTIMGTGYAWDCAVAFLCDFGGNDRYQAAGGGTQGNGAQAGLGVLFDYGGDDVYLGSTQGRASPSITYHSLPACGGNFSFVVDYGGQDRYGCGAKDNTYNRRSNDGGFLIDRPLQSELQHAAGDQPDKPRGT